MTYFVQHNKGEKEGYARCIYCNREFKPRTKKHIYCSKECYREGIKFTKKVWYQKNRERLVKKQLDYKRRKEQEKLEQGIRTLRPANKKTRLRTRYYRDCIIKQQLLNLELTTFQMTSWYRKRHNPIKINYRKNLKHKPREDLIKFIRRKLTELELYEEQIEVSDKYNVDLDDFDKTFDLFRRMKPPNSKTYG